MDIIKEIEEKVNDLLIHGRNPQYLIINHIHLRYLNEETSYVSIPSTSNVTRDVEVLYSKTNFNKFITSNGTELKIIVHSNTNEPLIVA